MALLRLLPIYLTHLGSADQTDRKRDAVGLHQLIHEQLSPSEWTCAQLGARSALWMAKVACEGRRSWQQYPTPFRHSCFGSPYPASASPVLFHHPFLFLSPLLFFHP